MRSADVAIWMTSRKTIISPMMSPLARIAFFGVRCFGWRREKKRGMSPPRPIENATRDEEKIREGTAAKDPTSTPTVMSKSPRSGEGNVRCATRTSVTWLASIGFVGTPGNPRTMMVTKPTATKIAVATVNVKKCARGMSFVGLRVSSPVCAMISYPSNTMNVSPIAMRTTTADGYEDTLSKNGLRFEDAEGFLPHQVRPKTTKSRMTARSTTVIAMLERPVAFAPR